MKVRRATLALAVLLTVASASAAFAAGGRRGGGGGGGNGGGGGGGAGREAGAPVRAPNNNPPQNNPRGNVANGANNGGQAQAHTSYYRGNNNINRNNSAFFGSRGAFGNAYAGNRAFINYGNYGRGFGYGGYGGYGGFGLGYGGGGFLPFLGGLGLGYGLGGGLGGGGFGGYGGGGYGGYGGGNIAGGGVAGGNAAPVAGNNQPVAGDPTAQAAVETPANPPTSNGTDYVALGETDFHEGKYQQAIGAYRHALIDEPNNAGLMMLTAQALFQTGQWTQAAAATELAMGALPEDKWGTVVQNHAQLYGNVGDYTSQLKALEAAVKEKPDDPAMRFLLGFQFAYLNYPKEAMRELDKAVQLEGRDPAARRLHDVLAAKAGTALVGPVPESKATTKTTN